MFSAIAARTSCLLLAAIGVSSWPSPSAASVSMAHVTAQLSEGDETWLPAREQVVAWNTPARFALTSPDHAHEIRVVPRFDGFVLDYSRDGQPILEDIVVPAGASLLQPSDLGVALKIRVTALDP